MHRRILAVLITCLAAIAAASEIPELRAPGDPPILTVSGDIAVTNRDGEARFDLAMLRELGEETITTSTIWTQGRNDFTGVKLSALLNRLGVSGGTLKAVAINDYSVRIPVEDALTGSALVAYRFNGREMSIRNKGPLWIVYPFDSRAKYQSETYYSRSIWQLDRITVED